MLISRKNIFNLWIAGLEVFSLTNYKKLPQKNGKDHSLIWISDVMFRNSLEHEYKYAIDM
jgi:hypothetical protein